jgi:nucleotide-binding universal stress UspA family protein
MFLEKAAQQLEGQGVNARTRTREGDVAPQIAEELASGSYDLVVVGAPLPDLTGGVSFKGTSPKIAALSSCPVLIVRYETRHQMSPAAAPMSQVGGDGYSK